MSADDRWPMSYEPSAADAAHAASEIDDERDDDLDPARGILFLVCLSLVAFAVALVMLLTRTQ